MGRQTLKFDAFWMNQITTGLEIYGNPQGYLGFYGGGALTTGNALADMYLGRIQSYSERAASENGVVLGVWGECHFCSGTTPFGAPCNGANNIGNGEFAGDFAPRLIQLGLKFIF